MRIIIVALLATLFAATALANPFVPKADVLPRWQRSGSGAPADYAVWAAFLARYRSVGEDGIARLRYGKVTRADRDRLDAFVDTLGTADVDAMTRPQQLAFWINLYNAATVRLVLEHHPVATIRKIEGGLFNLGPWNKPVVAVAGAKLSLNDIEHRIIRPIHNDPRIHFAVNCAALGCPDLAERPFAAATIDADLDAAARTFIKHPRGLRIDHGKLVGSSIFDWYAADFGGGEGVVGFAIRYADDSMRRLLQGRNRIDRFSYDWSLNEDR